MKVRIWGARGSIPAPLTPQVVYDKLAAALLGMAELGEAAQTELISAILARAQFAPTPNQDAAQSHALRRQVVDHYLTHLSPLAASTAGGNTPCVEIRSDHDLFIIDAGSGIRSLGLELMQGPWGRGEGTIHLFFSHPHWDHIQGFPFFRPAFVPGNKLFMYSVHDLETALRRQQEPLSFPVSLDYMQAEITFIRLEPGEVRDFGDVRVRNIRNHHPGDAYSFRFEQGDKSFVYASDASYPEGADLRPYLNFFAEADLLVFDSQFTQKESNEKEDWGHSSSFFGVEMAQKAKVETLLLFHYDPTYTDSDLERILADTQKFQQNQYPDSTQVKVLIAQEGQTFDLAPTRKTQVEQVPGSQAAILKPTGIFDEHVAAELREQFEAIVERNKPAQIIVDLTGVEMLEVAGLRALVKLRNDQRGIPVVLTSPSPNVQQLIELAGYLDFFAIYPSVHAALSNLQARETFNLPGQIIKNRYKVIGKVGEGRLGTVFKAIDLVHHSEIALKVLSPSFSEGAIERFLRQARQIVDLAHPNITTIYDCDVDRGISFMAQEFIEGQTLRHLLNETPDQPLPLHVALGIADNITRALEYAHPREVVHGDLKPKNVMLADRVRINDFGLGRLESGRSLIDLNVPLVMASAHYLAPEQILGHPLDARTDLYALGIILYEMMTGRPPYQGSDQEILEQHLNKLPTPPRELNPAISQLLEHLILRLLDKDPTKRYASARQVRRILNMMSLINSGEIEKYPYSSEFWPGLVGRQAELSLLLEAWDRSQQGQGQLVILAGEVGVGKTRLIEEFVSSLESATVLTGQCPRLPGCPPYAPLITAARSYFKQISQTLPAMDRTQTFLGRIWTELVQLVPPFGQFTLDIPHLSSSEETTRVSVEPLVKTLVQATSHRPWLLVLDDAQWIDPASLRLLYYLAHAVDRLAMMIIIVIDPQELTNSKDLRTVLTNLAKLPHCTEIAMEPLSQPETRELLENIWLQPVPPDLCTTLHDRAQGNPLLITEIAKGLNDSKAVVWQTDRWYFGPAGKLVIPARIEQAIAARFETLGPDTQTLLNQAAVLGPVFQLDDLIEMSSFAMDRALDGLDRALERQILREMPYQQTLSFNHLLIRQTLYEKLTPAKRRNLHHEAGEALERLHLRTPDTGSTLAHHFLAANDRDRGSIHSLRAAAQAVSIYANETALYWYSKALDAMAGSDKDQPQLHHAFEILMAREKIYNLLGDRKSQLSDLQTLEQLAQSLGEPVKVALVHNRRAAFEYSVSNFLDTQTQAQAGLLAAQQAGDLLIYSESLYRLAQPAMQRGEFNQAETHLGQAQLLVKKSKNPRAEARILDGFGHLYRLQGQFTESGNYHQQALAISQLAGDRHRQALYLSNLADIFHLKGDIARAKSYQQQALILNRIIGKRQGEAYCLNRLSLIHRTLGKYDLARNFAEQAITLHRVIDDSRGEAADLYLLGTIYALSMGDYVRARNYIGQALHLAQSAKDRILETEVWLELGLTFEGLGDFTKAVHAYEQIKLIEAEVGYRRGALDADAGLVRCLLHDNHAGQAEIDMKACLEQLAARPDDWTLCYPAKFYLTAYHAFSQSGDTAAALDALAQGNSFLDRRAAQLEEAELRQSFLTSVADHHTLRELLKQEVYSGSTIFSSGTDRSG
jgi:anti-anti-sigma factor